MGAKSKMGFKARMEERPARKDLAWTSHSKHQKSTIKINRDTNFVEDRYGRVSKWEQCFKTRGIVQRRAEDHAVMVALDVDVDVNAWGGIGRGNLVTKTNLGKGS
ncbi:hypothetical protein VNO80_15146 [Phaseolus coccineus]|uniref:Uncharacterized protein n=1 Tax=Phaseolus coccineus TaxID=3886 RepID=A0AAN9MPU8_PHACN